MENLLQTTSLARRALWLVHLRWAAIAVLMVATIVCRRVLAVQLASHQLAVLSGLVLVYNTALYGLLRWLMAGGGGPSSKAVGRIIRLEISVDLAILTAILHFSGGIENPFAFFFVFHMIIASILCSRRESYLQAGLASVLFGSLIWLESRGTLPHYSLEGFAGHGLHTNPVFVMGTLFVFAVTLFLVVFMTTSIAEQLRVHQDDLEKANLQLQQKDTLKNEYVLRVTHDIKGHLAAIQSCIDTVYDGLLGPLNEAQKDMIGRAHRRTSQALAFLSDLLKLTRTKLDGLPAITCFPLKAMIAKTLAAAKSRAEAKGIQVSVDVAPEIEIVCGEQILIEETILNLLFNAVKYTPQGGKVRMEVRDQGPDVLVRVLDNGMGIPEAEMDKIFSEFYRATNARAAERDGTGLGLSFAKQVVEQHGGRIGVQNNPDGGCTFSFTLPKNLQKATKSPSGGGDFVAS
jgi:signal transduction histidine kinase